MSELRWNPLLGEWVITARHRQQRTFLPPANFCPFCPARPGGPPTEVPEPDYDIVVFENRFPSLKSEPDEPAVAATDLYPVRPSQGVCEVVLYSPRHTSSLAEEPVEQTLKLVNVWADRTRDLGRLEFVDYVFVFENKGEEVGVTLTHPHGQIYAYPFVPPSILRELEQSRERMQTRGTCLICDISAEEKRDGRRIVAENDSFRSYIPFFARWPYEVHIVSRRHVGSIDLLDARERMDLASILKSVLMAFDGLFSRPFPYMMALHQTPMDGRDHGHYHFHVEFYPPMRAANRLKYLASSELGAGTFINDTMAEEKAAEMRAHVSVPTWVMEIV
jgi:UDPglucose--hexose-1-phosphate uridylyltransferase